ncbi:MAG: glycosyltransferase [Propionibacteriaceae bacterium]
MKVAAAIVSYNPTVALPHLVETLIAAGIPVEVVDNASSTGLEHLLASRDAGATVTTLDTNTGVAGALQTALDGTTADWLLTVDQDSTVTPESLAKLVGSAATEGPTVAVVAPVALDQESGEPLQGDPTKTGWYEVERVITSGALCRAVALRAVGGFRTDLVIDFVDWDLCVRLRRARWLIAIEPGAILEHSIGHSTRHHLPLVGDVTTTNHTPDRQYYKYRNYVLLARAGKLGPDTRWSLRTALGLGLGIGKVLAFEDDKAAKITAIAAGVRDGVAGRTGSRGGGRRDADGVRASAPQGPDAEESPTAAPTPRPPVSVCMATYNGAEYLRPQLDSILAQLEADDELLVQDDGSSDETLSIIASYADPRIEVVRNEANLGVIGTFERCLVRARHAIVFLSDQDDEWLPGKVDAVVAQFADPHVTGVVTNAVIVDAAGAQTGDSYFAHARSGPGVVHNFLKNSYLGCCLAVRRDVIGVAIPVPRSVRTHDGWIGITADLMGEVVFLPTPYLRYRRHGGNVDSMTRSGAVDIVRRRLALAAHLARITPRVLWRPAARGR